MKMTPTYSPTESVPNARWRGADIPVCHQAQPDSKPPCPETDLRPAADRNVCPTKPHRLEACATGFTLIEVLIALGIFAIGMVGVASLFPVAAILQKQTRQDVVGQHVSDNAVAIVRAKGLSETELTSYAANNANVEALFLMDSGSTVLDARFPIGDRSYPTYIPLDYSSPNPAVNRDIYWVPMIQDRDLSTGSRQWVMYLFVLEGDSQLDYTDKMTGIWANPGDSDPSVPGVTFRSASVPNANELDLGAGHNLRAGDMILDNNGTTYTIASVNGDVVTVIGVVLRSPADPTYIWYAPPGRNPDSGRVVGSSPTLDIVVISNSSEASKRIVTP